MENKHHSDRIELLDLAKWICAWLVVTIHTKPFRQVSRPVDLYLSQGLCRFAVPLFFAAAGFLLFRKLSSPAASFREENRNVLFRYMKKVIRLYLTWSCIYYIFAIQGWAINGMLTKQFIFEQARLFFFEASYYHLWYLLATIYAVPLVYILYRMGKKWQRLYIALVWPFRCLQYAYNWTGLFSEQYMWMQEHADVVFNVILCAVPLMTLGVLAIDEYKQYDSVYWLKKTIIWLLIYMAELSLGAYFVPDHDHFEFLFSCPSLIYHLFCWILTQNFRIRRASLSRFWRISSLWIYCVHPLFIQIFGIFSGDTGIVRYIFVCAALLLTSIGYSCFETKKG